MEMKITGAMEAVAEDYGCTLEQECDDTIRVVKNYIGAEIRFASTGWNENAPRSYGVAFDGMNAAYNEGTTHWSAGEAKEAADVMLVAAAVIRLLESVKEPEDGWRLPEPLHADSEMTDKFVAWLNEQKPFEGEYVSLEWLLADDDDYTL